MSRGDFVSKDFKVVLMEHIIEKTHQDIGPTKCANQTIVTIAKHMLKTQKLEKSLWMEAMSIMVYT
jgi:hypothetical protein